MQHFCKRRLLPTKMAENVGHGKDKLWKWRACIFSLLFLQVRSRRVKQVEGYSRWSYHSTIEDDFWIWVAFYYRLFPKEHHSSTVAELVQVPSERRFLLCHFLSKTWHRTASFIVFHLLQIRNTVLYSHQVSIFRAIEARRTHIFQLFPPFCSKRSKQAVWAWQK